MEPLKTFNPHHPADVRTGQTAEVGDATEVLFFVKLGCVYVQAKCLCDGERRTKSECTCNRDCVFVTVTDLLQSPEVILNSSIAGT